MDPVADVATYRPLHVHLKWLGYVLIVWCIASIAVTIYIITYGPAIPADFKDVPGVVIFMLVFVVFWWGLLSVTVGGGVSALIWRLSSEQGYLRAGPGGIDLRLPLPDPVYKRMKEMHINWTDIRDLTHEKETLHGMNLAALLRVSRHTLLIPLWNGNDVQIDRGLFVESIPTIRQRIMNAVR